MVFDVCVQGACLALAAVILIVVGGCIALTGYARLNHQPGEDFMEMFKKQCVVSRFWGFRLSSLAVIVNGGSIGLVVWCSH
jgi:hypothetical protein